MFKFWRMDGSLEAVRSDGLRIRRMESGAPYRLETADGRVVQSSWPSGSMLFLTALHQAQSVPLGPDHYDWARHRRALARLQRV